MSYPLTENILLPFLSGISIKKDALKSAIFSWLFC